MNFLIVFFIKLYDWFELVEVVLMVNVRLMFGMLGFEKKIKKNKGKLVFVKVIWFIINIFEDIL